MTNRTRRRLEVEGLEGKLLLSSGAAGPTLTTGSVLTSKPNVSMSQNGLLFESGLATKLTTDKAVYHAGQTVHITLTVTNTTNHVMTVGLGPSIDGFGITRKGVMVHRTNGGINPMFIVAIPLQPGASQTITASWEVTITGTFVVHSARTAATATFRVV